MVRVAPFRAFHRRLCAATWPTTGMLELLDDDHSRGMSPAAEDCFSVSLFPASSGLVEKF